MITPGKRSLCLSSELCIINETDYLLLFYYRGMMWASVVVCLIVCGLVFYVLARFHEHITALEEGNKRARVNPVYGKKKQIISLSILPTDKKCNSDMKYAIMKEQYAATTVEGNSHFSWDLKKRNTVAEYDSHHFLFSTKAIH